MEGKYQRVSKFWSVRAQRAVLRAVIRPLIPWRPLANPEPGYTIIVGSPAPLSGLLFSNLRMLQRQQLSNLDRILIVLDCTPWQMPRPVEAQLRSAFPDLPLQVLYYSRTQSRILHTIGWGWTYAWLSWCKGIAACRTRYAMLHDLDAMLLRPDAVEQRYEAILREGKEYCGVRYYEGNGLVPDDGLVTTFELMFDAAFVRQTFRPIDLFNHVTMHNGRSVDFDTFLYAQSRAGRGFVVPLGEEDMVHPSQMICQFTYLMNRRRYVPPAANNLPLIPYFLYVGGETEPLIEQTRLLEQSDGFTVPFFGRVMDISRLTPIHLEWLMAQTYRLERAVTGEVREEVQRYLDAIQLAFEQRNRTRAPMDPSRRPSQC